MFSSKNIQEEKMKTLSGLQRILSASLIGIASISGCDKIDTARSLVEVDETFIRDVGKYDFRVIKYCGMPNKDVFSVATGDGPNIFYPLNTKSFKWTDHREYKVISVTPERIILSVKCKQGEK